MTPPISQQKDVWLVNGAILIASLAVALFLVEIVLRIIGFSAPVLYTYDDITGSKLFAGAHGWQRTEGEAFIAINREGLRDREHDVHKPPKTFRIAILGDSMAEALQVSLQDAFWSVLGARLKTCEAFKGQNVEVINFGVSGYGTAQELLTFRHRVTPYTPDLTILAFYAGNDIRNNSKALESFKLRPFFNLHKGRLVLDDSFLNNHEYRALKSTFDTRKIFFGLRTFQLVRRLKSVFEQRQRIEVSATSETNIEPGLDDSVFLVPASEAWKSAWDITERLIVATRDEVVARGGYFLLLSIPIGIQVYPNPDVRKQFARKLGVEDLWYPESRLQSLGKSQNIDVLTLGKSLQAYAETHRLYLHGFSNTRLGTGHLNRSGHELVGGLLAEHLCSPSLYIPR